MFLSDTTHPAPPGLAQDRLRSFSRAEARTHGIVDEAHDIRAAEELRDAV